MRGDLRVVRAKLGRAHEHLQAFDRVLGDFLGSNPYSVAFEFENETGWHRFRWVVNDPGREPPTDDLALIFGDFLYNLNATLDYLVWQLVRASNNEPSTRNEFPLCMRPENWASMRGDRLQGVDDRWTAMIETLQPYHGGDRPEIHPLAILNHVNNINKHRVLPTTIMGVDTWMPRIHVERMATGEGLHFASFLSKPIEHGADFFRFRCDSRQQLHVEVNEPPIFRVSFRDGLNHNWYNADLFTWVSDVVVFFEPAFTS